MLISNSDLKIELFWILYCQSAFKYPGFIPKNALHICLETPSTASCMGKSITFQTCPLTWEKIWTPNKALLILPTAQILISTIVVLGSSSQAAASLRGLKDNLSYSNKDKDKHNFPEEKESSVQPVSGDQALAMSWKEEPHTFSLKHGG